MERFLVCCCCGCGCSCFEFPAFSALLDAAEKNKQNEPITKKNARRATLFPFSLVRVRTTQWRKRKDQTKNRLCVSRSSFKFSLFRMTVVGLATFHKLKKLSTLQSFET